MKRVLGFLSLSLLGVSAVLAAGLTAVSVRLSDAHLADKIASSYLLAARNSASRMGLALKMSDIPSLNGDAHNLLQLLDGGSVWVTDARRREDLRLPVGSPTDVGACDRSALLPVAYDGRPVGGLGLCFAVPRRGFAASDLVFGGILFAVLTSVFAAILAVYAAMTRQFEDLIGELAAVDPDRPRIGPARGGSGGHPDVAKIRQTLGQLIDRIARASERSARQRIDERTGAMAAQVAHDIRAPLSAISTALASITGAAPESLELLRAANARLRRIADDLLEARRSPAPDGNPPVATVEQVAGDIRRLAAEFQARFPGLRVLFDCTAVGAGALRADRSGLERILANLLSNAVEARGPSPGTVRLSLAGSAGAYMLSVRDDGPGIPSALLPRVGTAGVTTKAEGHGLGLASARERVEGWGGSLKISSPPEGGCVVELSFRAPEG